MFLNALITPVFGVTSSTINFLLFSVCIYLISRGNYWIAFILHLCHIKSMFKHFCIKCINYL